MSKKKCLEKKEYSYYRKKDHWNKNHFKLTRYKEKEGSIANVAHRGDGDSDIALICSSATGHKDEWTLNSGWTDHICSNREYFLSWRS